MSWQLGWRFLLILGLSCQIHANLNQAWRLHFEQVEVGGSSNSLRPGLHVGTATFSGPSVGLPQAFNLLENTLSRATVLVGHELLVALQHFQSSQTTR